MTFQEGIATQPGWVQVWVLFMGIAITVAVLLLFFSKETRRDAVVIAVTMAAVLPSMYWLHGQFGYVRLLGIVHVIFWTPLAYYLWRRLGDGAIGTPQRQMIWLLVATLLISLAFDYADVARYLMGERGSMVS